MPACCVQRGWRLRHAAAGEGAVPHPPSAPLGLPSPAASLYWQRLFNGTGWPLAIETCMYLASAVAFLRNDGHQRCDGGCQPASVGEQAWWALHAGPGACPDPTLPPHTRSLPGLEIQAGGRVSATTTSCITLSLLQPPSTWPIYCGWSETRDGALVTRGQLLSALACPA